MSNTPMGEDSLNRHIGQRMAEIRRVRSMTQAQVARSIGLCTGAYRKLEYGQTRHTAWHLYQLSELFDVPVSFFFDLYVAPVEVDTIAPEPIITPEPAMPTVSSGPMAVREHTADAPALQSNRIDLCTEIGLIKAAMSVRSPRATEMVRQIVRIK